jgi:hypothetical protein
VLRRTRTPTLRSALLHHHARGVDALASALLDTTSGVPHPELTTRLAANQVLTVLQVLANANQRRIDEGRSADELAPLALAEADHAFELLRSGLTPYS